MGDVGNSLHGTGYGCELPAMVADWRAAWSASTGTTDPLAPFGVASWDGSTTTDARKTLPEPHLHPQP